MQPLWGLVGIAVTLGKGSRLAASSVDPWGSQEFWKLGDELQKHLASQMGQSLGNSAQAVSLQTLEGLWETQADAADAWPCPGWGLPSLSTVERKDEPLQIQIQLQSSFFLRGTFLTEGCPEVHMAYPSVTGQTDCHTSQGSRHQCSGKSSVSPDSGLALRKDTTHTGDVPEMCVSMWT